MSKRRTFSNLVDVNVRELQYTDERDFDAYVEKFLTHSSAKNLSKETIKFYDQKLALWRNTLEELGITTDVTRCDREVIERYVDYFVNERGWKYVSVKTSLRAVKAFFNFLRNIERVIDRHGFDDFVISGTDKSGIETFSQSQITRLLSEADPKLFTGVRNYTIMLTFLETGVRLRELCDIDIPDVNFTDRVIKILGKNGSYRYVPFQAKYANVLRQYLKVRGSSPVDSLFITHDDTKLSRRAVQQFLSRYGKKANITDKRVSPHTFRHTFAKMYIQNGGDPFSLQQILGHSTMDMVKVYVNMFGKELDEAHRKFSPLSRILR